MTSINTQSISYQSNDTTLHGHLAYDSSHNNKRPGILIVHEWWGQNDYVRSRAEQYAAQGYIACAIDLYGEGQTASTPDKAGALMTQAIQTLPTQGRAFFEAAMTQLQHHAMTDTTSLSAVGYCFGGTVVLEMARLGLQLHTVAALHPGSLATQTPLSSKISTQILVYLGQDDPFIPSDQRQAFESEMNAAQANYEFIQYPETQHGFTVPEATERGQQFNLPLAYHKTSDHHSWDHLLQRLPQP